VPTSLAETIRLLGPEEPDLHHVAAALGAEAIPHLERLAQSADLSLATKATFVAGLIGAEALEIVRSAARDWRPAMRVTAATALPFIGTGAAIEIAPLLLGDPDPGVRKTALRSASGPVRTQLRATIERIAADDPSDLIRELAAEALESPGRE